MRMAPFVLAVTGLTLARPVDAQEPKKTLVIITFDQLSVQDNLREVFERDGVNVGLSIARLVARRLGDAYTVVEAPGALPWGSDPATIAAVGRQMNADAVLAGTVIVFGSGSATAGVAAPRIGGVRVGIGRRTTTALVSLEARLVDVASNELLGVFPGQATDSRSGVGLFARVPNLIDEDGVIDMTRTDFAETLLGTVTGLAVGQVAEGVVGSRGRIGAVAVVVAPPPPAAPVVAAGPVVAAVPVTGTWTGGPFAWVPWQFGGTEQFQYTITQVQGGDREEGTYELGFSPVGDGRVRMRVNGRLGEESYSSTVTTRFEGQQSGIGYQELAALGPAGIMLFNPAAWIMMWGRELTIGDEWSQSSGGESFSIRVDRECQHGGQRGALIVMRENGRVMMESCVSPDVPLPLRMLTDSEGDRWEMTLVSFSR